jgi:probable selenium-dependent hydroxylase accessory protein YqeC
MRLSRALRLSRLPRLALVGAGGKTTVLFQLARELLESSPPGFSTVLVTTTTHLGVWQSALADHHIVLKSPPQVELMGQDLPEGVVLVTGPQVDSERLNGLDPATAPPGQEPFLTAAGRGRWRPYASSQSTG